MAPALPTAAITLPTGPELSVGPLELPWHGLMTALGLLVGAMIALRFTRERGLSPDRVLSLILIAAIAGMIGARIFYLVEQEPAALLRPTEWLGSTGFSFYGAMIAAVAAALVYLRRDLELLYLDALASGFGLAMAVGRVGDILIGEHLGPPSELPWAITYSNPEALAPSTEVAYQPGPLYESLLGLLIFALVWPARGRFRRPGSLLVAVVALYAAGRFAMFFVRSDSDALALGLSNAQITSLVILLACGAAFAWIRRSPEPKRGEPVEGSAQPPPAKSSGAAAKR